MTEKWTVLYDTTGSEGMVVNRYGSFSSEQEAEDYIIRAGIATGRAVKVTRRRLALPLSEWER